MNYFNRVATYFSAIRGNPKAQYNIACLMSQKDDPEAKDRAFTWYKHAAEKGHPDACMHMIKYALRINDSQQAIKYLKLSLPTENGVNESLLGQILLNGYTQYIDQKKINGANVDPSTELDHYIHSLYPKNEDPHVVGITPEQAEQNRLEALSYLDLGVEKNNPLALHALAIYTLEYAEKLSKQNQDQAISWLTKAAAQNFAPSLQALAGMNENGLYGFKPNIDKGLKLRVQAAETGSKEAQYSLGMLVYKGNGFKQNRSQGLELMTMAANQGHSEAIDFLKSLKEKS